MNFLEILSVMFIASYVCDLSGVIPKLSRMVFRLVFGKNVKYNGWQIPLLSCSKCVVFWSVLFIDIFLKIHIDSVGIPQDTEGNFFLIMALRLLP